MAEGENRASGTVTAGGAGPDDRCGDGVAGDGPGATVTGDDRGTAVASGVRAHAATVADEQAARALDRLAADGEVSDAQRAAVERAARRIAAAVVADPVAALRDGRTDPATTRRVVGDWLPAGEADTGTSHAPSPADD